MARIKHWFRVYPRLSILISAFPAVSVVMLNVFDLTNVSILLNSELGGVQGMAPANIIIRDFGVDQSGIQLGVTEEPLNLFHGHPILK